MPWVLNGTSIEICLHIRCTCVGWIVITIFAIFLNLISFQFYRRRLTLFRYLKFNYFAIHDSVYPDLVETTWFYFCIRGFMLTATCPRGYPPTALQETLPLHPRMILLLYYLKFFTSYLSNVVLLCSLLLTELFHFCAFFSVKRFGMS